MKILAISGSLKKDSTNGAILRLIQELCGHRAEIEMYNGLATLPHFSPDLDNGNVPVSVANFRKSIQGADGVIICTPEYIFSLPGALKNALEWTVSTTVFSAKPVAMVVASASGDKAYDSLRLIMETLGAKMDAQTKLLIPGAKGKFNEHGQLTDDDVLNQIRHLSAAILEAADNPRQT